jgi:hypothetical protein
MGIYTRPDSPCWWYFNEKTKEKVKTEIRIGLTTQQRKDAKQLASDVYHQVMNDQAKGVHHLHQERPEIRFAAYAGPYETDVINHRAGKDREQEMLKHLVAFFGDDLLTKITKERVGQYHTHRKSAAGARTINREVDLLKVMLRDAVPTYLAASPIVGMKRLRIVPPRRRYVSKDEFEQLLDVCEDAQDTALLLLARDGLPRLKDLIYLQHTDRDPHHERILSIADPKGNEPIEMALSDRALAAINALAGNGSTFLFPKFRRAEKPRDWTGSVRQRLEYLCRQADLEYGRTKNGITFHWGMRRSGATDYIRDGKNLKAIQSQGGWKKPNVLLEIYTEVSRDDKLALVDAAPAKKTKKRKRA